MAGWSTGLFGSLTVNVGYSVNTPLCLCVKIQHDRHVGVELAEPAAHDRLTFARQSQATPTRGAKSSLLSGACC